MATGIGFLVLLGEPLGFFVLADLGIGHRLRLISQPLLRGGHGWASHHDHGIGNLHRGRGLLPQSPADPPGSAAVTAAATRSHLLIGTP